MLASVLASGLPVKPALATFVLVFFVYGLLGYVLECIVLTIEKRRLVLNRGFVRHLPFCIIYGFGAIFGYALLYPLKHNFVLLFVVGAAVATGFEYLVARLQIHIFGDFWWDYTKKPFNFHGILCLESTLGWGFAAILIVGFLHAPVVQAVAMVPSSLASVLAVALVCAYLLDFAFSARCAARQKRQQHQLEMDTAFDDPTDRTRV